MTIGDDIRYYEKVSSTNELAADLINRGKARHGTVISASYQVAGRGQRHNKWHSKALSNLIISVLLKPKNIKPCNQFYISMIISISIVEVLNKYADPFEIKWPNDIYFRGDKIAGILIENSISGSEIIWSVCGIGININETEFPGFLPNPVSLKSITGKDYNISIIMQEILLHINRWYKRIESHNFDYIRSKYLEYLFGLNKESLFKANDTSFRGVVTGVNESGQIIIRRRDGQTLVFSFKELEFC